MTEWLLVAAVGPILLCLGLYVWRRPRRLSGSPYIAAAWSSLFVAGLIQLWLPESAAALVVRRLLLAGFSGCMLAGAYRQVRRPIPAWVLPAAIGAGLVQAFALVLQPGFGLAAGGAASGALMMQAGRVLYVHRSPHRSQLIAAGLCVLFVAMGALLAVGDLAVWSGTLASLPQIQLWLGLSMVAGFLQLLSWADIRGKREANLREQRDALRRIAHSVVDADPRASLVAALVYAESKLEIGPLRVLTQEGETLRPVSAQAEDAAGNPGLTGSVSIGLSSHHPVVRQVLSSEAASTWGDDEASPLAEVFGVVPGFAARITYGGIVVGLIVGGRPPGTDAEVCELATDLSSEIGRVLGTAAGWERQVAQARALEEYGLRLGQMIEAVPAGFLLADADRNVRHANRRLLDLLRIPASARIDDLPALAARLESRIAPSEWLACLGRASPAAVDLVLQQPRQVLSITAHPVGPKQAPDDRVWVIRDVTDERELSERVHQMERLETVGTLAGGLAHDFNNQLTAILGNARLVLDEMAPDDPERAALLDLEESARHCAELTASLLSFARSEKSELSQVDVVGLIDRAVALVRPLLPPGVELTSHVDPYVGSVDADPVQLSRVLTNLLVNARDAVGNVGHIQIAAGRSAGDLPVVTFEVRDDGVGMSEEVRRRVFEPFFTAREVGHGSGLGLSVVYGIVSAHGGAVDVDSAPDLGSTFRVHWPVYADGLDEELPAAAEPRRNATVLLAEDQPPVRRLVRNALERAGFNVHECADGREALERYTALEGAVDLLLFDLSMPHMGGLQALAELRRNRPDLPALVMSGHPDRDRGSDAWPEDVALLAKPFGPQRLVAAARRALTV